MSIAMEPMKVQLGSALGEARGRNPCVLSLNQACHPFSKAPADYVDRMVQQNAFLMQQNDFLMRHYQHIQEELLRLQLSQAQLKRPQLDLERPVDIASDHSRESTSTYGSDTDQEIGLRSVKTTKDGPARTIDRESTAASEQDEAHSTIVIKNLVVDCTRKDIEGFLNAAGFAGLYDLVYLPLDFKSKKCFHYAFVNFISEGVALQFEAGLNGFQNEKLFGDKCCDISWSDCQGVEAAVEYYRNSPVMHPDVPEECKPVLYANGKVLPFPAPTKAIAKPRRNRHRK
jgi:hypothetical protein